VTELFPQNSDLHGDSVQFGAGSCQFAGQPFDRGVHLTFPFGVHADPVDLISCEPAATNVVQGLPGDSVGCGDIVGAARIVGGRRPLFVVCSECVDGLVGELSFTHDDNRTTVNYPFHRHVGLSVSGEHVGVAGGEELFDGAAGGVSDPDGAEQTELSEAVTVKQFAASGTEPHLVGDRVASWADHTKTPPVGGQICVWNLMSHRCANFGSLTSSGLIGGWHADTGRDEFATVG